MSLELEEISAFDPFDSPGTSGASWTLTRQREREFTTGGWTTEAESKAAFDRAVPADLFDVHGEVRGTLLSPRPGQVDRSMRIDRLLVPTQDLLDLGWQFGIVGVEIKKSGVKIGPVIGQAMDYSRTVWTLEPSKFRVMTDYTFIWPMAAQGCAVGSILAQNRIGSADMSSYVRLKLKCGETPILHVSPDPHGTVRVGKKACGARAGSR